ncbi:uncharacterized protein [Musca autumnalis]|uniref:uncharacterized protein n=1 Tax=Musca autumnalis TaxID=221902 RepID=UPI003CF182A9
MLYSFGMYRYIFIIIASGILCLPSGSEGAQKSRLPCERPGELPNGSFRIKRNFMRVFCNSGYTLQGLKTIGCVHGKWDGEKPVCAKKGCSRHELEVPENGRLQFESELKAILYCMDSYIVAGNRHTYCNGTHWDRPLGTCRKRTGQVSHECDFETDDVCGWTYEPMENYEWKRVAAANAFTSFKTGPRTDHTTMTRNGGHYMLMETLIRQDMPVTLTSPIYDRELSLKTACCFQFHYYMYGAGVGDLLVVVKPLSMSLDDILLSHDEQSTFIKFERNGNQSNTWNEAHFSIEELDEDFQIVFVAKSGRNHLSDIAVDDVRLMTGDDCKALDKSNDETLSNEEYETTTYESIYDMQSCANRCFKSDGMGIFRLAGVLNGLCSCTADCEGFDTCCPDFKAICLTELFEETTEETSQNGKGTQVITSTTTPATTQSTTIRPTSTTTQIVPTTRTTTTTTSTTLKPTTTTIITTIPTTTTTTTTRTTPTSTTAKPTTTTTKTTPSTTTRKTTTSTTTTTTTTRKPTRATTRATKATTQTSSTSTTTVRPTTSTTSTQRMETSEKPIVKTSTKKSFIAPKSKTYLIDNTSQEKNSHHGPTILLWIFVATIIIIIVGLAYRRFGDSAVAWYMIRFSNRSCGDDGAAVATTYNGTAQTAENKSGKNKRTKPKKKSNVHSSDFTRPLVDDDDDYDDIDENWTTNGSIVLKENTEL